MKTWEEIRGKNKKGLDVTEEEHAIILEFTDYYLKKIKYNNSGENCQYSCSMNNDITVEHNTLKNK